MMGQRVEPHYRGAEWILGELAPSHLNSTQIGPCRPLGHGSNSTSPMKATRSQILFFGTYLILFAICAIGPHERTVWAVENLPIVLLVGAIALVGRHHNFSPLSYGLMFFLVALHTIGGHYTFELVPFDWVTNTFGFERNHYDRMAHFTVGF
jgi:uncharacterized membrane protein YjdF